MVYRGKPSAGCENCRKAKKRCTLEQPACLRCIKLKKVCSGYRDTKQLQIQDESESVRQKAERQKVKNAEREALDIVTDQDISAEVQAWDLVAPGSAAAQPRMQHDSPVNGVDVFVLSNAIHGPTGTSDDDLDLDLLDMDDQGLNGFREYEEVWGSNALTRPIRPKVDEVVIKHFIDQFTSNGHWKFMQGFAREGKLDPCLTLAMKACGMAALTNVELVPQGRDYARSAYVEALHLLNESLRDPKRCKTDEALIAVSMLGYYENISCENKTSIQSWKAHINGASNLLRLRGKAQFKTAVGRIMFREIRTQILIHCIWDDLEPPEYLLEYQRELRLQTPVEFQHLSKPGDALTSLCFEFARLRAYLRERRISNLTAMQRAGQLESWEYHELEVEESEHIWNGTVYHYPGGFPAPAAWNTWRSMRIMLTRTREMLLQRVELPAEEREQQVRFFRKTRRQMTDEICATIPPCLGTAGPSAMNSQYVLITAYASVWPLFFAGTCLLERVGPSAWSILHGAPVPEGTTNSAAFAQATWVMDRLHFISQAVGLRWADGVAAVLRGEFLVAEDEFVMGSETDDPVRAYMRALTASDRAPWLKKIEKKHRGPKALIEPDNPLTDSLLFDGPIWLGQELKKDDQVPPRQPRRLV